MVEPSREQLGARSVQAETRYRLLVIGKRVQQSATSQDVPYLVYRDPHSTEVRYGVNKDASQEGGGEKCHENILYIEKSDQMWNK